MGKRTTARWDVEPVPFISSEIELLSPSDSEFENCGFDEISADVAAMLLATLLKKWSKTLPAQIAEKT